MTHSRATCFALAVDTCVCACIHASKTHTHTNTHTHTHTKKTRQMPRTRIFRMTATLSCAIRRVHLLSSSFSWPMSRCLKTNMLGCMYLYVCKTPRTHTLKQHTHDSQLRDLPPEPVPRHHILLPLPVQMRRLLLVQVHALTQHIL